MSDALTAVKADASYAQIAVTFVEEVAPKVHKAFGGVVVVVDPDTGQPQTPPPPFKRLAVALQDYVPLEYGITVGPETPKEDWNALFTKVNSAEEAAHGKGKSPSAIFSRFALKVGENREFIEPWVGLIPDEFGLAVVKSAIAILLNFAEWHAEERQQLFDSLIEIRNIIGTASWKTKSFHKYPEVSKYGSVLYASIVDAIDKIFQSLPKKDEVEKKKLRVPRISVPWKNKKGDRKDGQNQQQVLQKIDNKISEDREAPKKKETRKKIDLSEILEPVKSAAKDLDHAVDEFDRKLGSDTNERAKIILDWVITEADPSMKNIEMGVEQIMLAGDQVLSLAKASNAKQDLTIQLLKANFDMAEARNLANPAFYAMLLENYKQGQAETNAKILRLEQAIHDIARAITPEPERKLLTDRPDRRRSPANVAREGSSATVTTPQLLRLLIPSSAYGEEGPDLKTILTAANADVDTIVRQQARIDNAAQAQLQSLFDTPRFAAWMETRRADLVLVESGTRSVGRESARVSAMTIFSVNFVLSMTHLQPDNVYVHFVCGLHDLRGASGATDPWAGGPSGVLRCVAVQLLVALEARDCRVRLDSARGSRAKEELERGDAERLAEVVRELACQFDPGTTVYCIVDGLALLCGQQHLADLETFVRCFEDVVAQGKNPAYSPFKILLTTTGRTPPALSRLVDADQHVRLMVRHELTPGRVTRRVMDARISSRLATPSPSGRSRAAQRRRSLESRSRSRGEDEEDSSGTDYGE
ncbi:hypothetical protein OQA88_13265 [Cercophora sp. LCS_1]